MRPQKTFSFFRPNGILMSRGGCKGYNETSPCMEVKRMDEMRKTVMTPEEDLIDLLLEFSIVALCLAQKVSRTMKDKQNKEGGNGYEI